MPQNNTVAATVSVMTTDRKGNPIMVKEGDLWASDDPFVRDRPDLFGPLDERKIKRSEPVAQPTYAEIPPDVPVIERATRAPGEVRRGPGRPRKDSY
jgi:hypothetical protein